MADLIVFAEARAWIESTKYTDVAIDSALLAQIQARVLARLGSIYTTTGWVSPGTTPDLVRSILAMQYVGWYIHRTFASDADLSAYGEKLLADAEALIQGILDGSLGLGIDFPETNPSFPSFYPNDASTGGTPSDEDPSLGPAAFGMGKEF